MYWIYACYLMHYRNSDLTQSDSLKTETLIQTRVSISLVFQTQVIYQKSFFFKESEVNYSDPINKLAKYGAFTFNHSCYILWLTLTNTTPNHCLPYHWPELIGQQSRVRSS